MEARASLKRIADGDGRSLLNMVEDIFYFQEHSSQSFHDNDSQLITPEELTKIISCRLQNRFYTPVEYGFEREIKKRLDWWDKLRLKKNQ